MIIAHSQPEGITWSIVGTGATNPGPNSNLADDRPDTLSAFTWLTGTQNTATVFKLRGEWAKPMKPGLAGFSNIRLPVGTKISVAWRRATDPAGTYPTTIALQNPGNIQRVYEGPRGERTALLLLQAHAITNIVGVEFTIWNDVGGVASIPAAEPFWLGEAFVREAITLNIHADWSASPIDTTTANYSTERQPYPDPGLVYHQLQFKWPLDTGANYFGDPSNPNAIDYEALIAKLDRGQSAVYITRTVDDGGAFSAHMLHRTAKLGLMTKLPASTHRAGPYFDSGAATVIEIPIPV